MFGEGISKEGELVDYGVKLDIIDKSGAWFSYGEKKLGQGKENAKAILKEDKELHAEIEAKIKEALGMTNMLSIDTQDIED
jgi:recombination protein RecA